MKRSEILFSVILLPVDFFMLFLAVFLSYHIRISPLVTTFRPVYFNLPLKDYLTSFIIVAPLCLIVFALAGLYKIAVTRRLSDEFFRIFMGVTMGLVAVVFYIFLRAELFQSRFLLLATWFLAIITVTSGRFFVRRLQVYLLKYGFGVHRVLLVGENGVCHTLREEFKEDIGMGYSVVATINKIIPEELEKIRKEKGVDEVIQCNPHLSAEENLQLLDFCEEYKIDYKYVPNLFETYATNVEVKTIKGIPLVELKRTPLDGWGRVAKRAVDLLGSGAGLVLLAPLFIIVAVLIKIDSPGPVFFRQIRVGKHGRHFRIFKFRSMVKDAEERKKELLPLSERKGPLFKLKDDPRVTRIGRILRRTRIDELPQLINVLKNDMSLIGPRPHLPSEVAQYQKHHLRLFTIKPGMTGLAQISGASDLAFEEEARLDIYYIENWSLKMDLEILLKTFKIILLLKDKAAV